MLRSQRILIIVGLLCFAWLLHASLCDWVFKQPLDYIIEGSHFKYVQQPILAKHDARQNYSGLVTQAHVDLADSVLFDVAMPLAMLLTVAYLWLGWRVDARLRQRLCPACGYNLRGLDRSSGCPECGAGRAATETPGS